MVTRPGRTTKRLLPSAFAGLLCLASVALLVSCGNPPSPAPLPTYTPPPTYTPLPTHTPFPTITSTPAPIDTPTPDSTPTPVSTPIPGPSATGTPAPTAMPEATPTVAPFPTPTIPLTPAPVSMPVPTSTPTLASMVEDVSPGVVQIVTLSGTGSGFIIDADGLVVTNAHVVQGFKTVDVRLGSGQSYQGEVLGVDEAADLALLDLREFRNFEPVALGDSDAVAVGEEVIAMGFPLGGNDILLGSPSVTSGIVSAKRVSKSGVKLLQSDAAVNPGSSGGPLFDRDGRVVGVNTGKLFESSDGRPVEGIGLAVAINEVRDRLDLLARGGDDTAPSPAQGTTDHTSTPVPADSFASVSAGGLHSCSLISDGSVVCWGSNEDPNGNFIGQATPPNGSFISVSTGGLHSCGVKTDNSVVCWGDDSLGQATPSGGSFTLVSAGGLHTCGLKTNWAVACWGANNNGQSSPPGSTFVSVSAGVGHTCGLRADRTIECWGYNAYGQSSPPAGSFVSVSSGAGHTCGVQTVGSVVCWGTNEDVHGNFFGQATPPNGSFTSVSAGFLHTCGLKTDASVVCWGDDSLSQYTPPGGSFVFVSAGYSHTCGLKIDGSVICWTDSTAIQTTPPTLPATIAPTPATASKPESTEGGRRVSVLKRQEGAPVNLG